MYNKKIIIIYTLSICICMFSAECFLVLAYVFLTMDSYITKLTIYLVVIS